MKCLAFTAVLLGLAFAASAQTTAPAEHADPQPAGPQTTDAASADASAKQDKADAKKDERADRNCLKYTGSRLIRADSKGRHCVNAAGRSYSKEDIDRTGATDLHDALRKLDPAVH